MKLFVWDFHGVLEKGNEKAVEEITNIVLGKFGFKRRITLDESRFLYGKKWFEYFEYLLPKENFDVWMKLQAECVELALNNPKLIGKHIQINDNAKEVLLKINEKHDQILLSNSSVKSLEMFLKVTGVDKYFKKNRVMALDAHKIKGARSKREELEHFLVGKMFENLVVIGDSPLDMELGLLPGSVRYLYAHPGTKHREVSADYKINDLREVLKEI